MLRIHGRLLFVGGKGGVGKTTVASAIALFLARQNPKRRILLVSTDPAHSLADSLNLSLKDAPAPVPGLTHLEAFQVNPEKTLAEFKAQNQSLIAEIACRGTYFDEGDIGEILSLSIPGLDEISAILKLMEIFQSRVYAHLIVDTAPTGHTLELLKTPRFLEGWIHGMDLMQAKHRAMARQFTGRYRPDPCDQFLNQMTRELQGLEALFRDPETTFLPVCLPEMMSVEETDRLLKSLRSQRIAVKDLVVNRVQTDGDCPFCRSVKAAQKNPLLEIQRRFSGVAIHRLPLYPQDIRGLEALMELGQHLLGKKQGSVVGHPESVSEGGDSWFVDRGSKNQPLPTARRVLARGLADALKQRRLVIIGGKGGVGKTTLAAATALFLAQGDPRRKVLLLSTDPAHSLADAFGLPIGSSPMALALAENLFAQQLDAPGEFARLKRDYQGEIDELFTGLVGGQGYTLTHDRAVMSELLSMAPPGLDEIMGFLYLMDLLEEQKYDQVVLDTAPTGHLLRFLELPKVMGKWLEAFFRLMLKYQRMVHLERMSESLLAVSKKLVKIHRLLQDSSRSVFIAVTIPEPMGSLETNRLLGALRSLRIPCEFLLVNRILPKTRCRFCARMWGNQRQHLRIMRGTFTRQRLIEFPQFPIELKGTGPLGQAAQALYGRQARR